jgi:hypothetical protein
MKKKCSYSTILLILGLAAYTTLNTSYSTGFSSYSNTSCPTCHGSNAPNTLISINNLPSTYSYGQSYPISVSITNSSKVVAGFQLLVSTGTLTTGDPSISIYGNNRSGGHNSPKLMNAGTATFNMIWTAPTSGNVAANFSAQGIGANGTGNTGGDSGAFITISNIVLPVRFVSISALIKKEDIVVAFETADEEDVESFTIERKTENSEFETVATLVPNQSGRYEYTDKDVEKNIRYQYRAVENDFTGGQTFSEIATVKISKENNLKLYPTIVKNSKINFEGLEWEEEYTINLFNLTGKNVFSSSLTSNQLTITDLASGLYIAQVLKNNTPVLTQKISFK